MSDNSVVADGFARILSEVNTWPDCKDLISRTSREMCDNPGPQDVLVFRDLQFPLGYKAKVRRCRQCQHVSLEIGLFQEATHEQTEVSSTEVSNAPRDLLRSEAANAETDSKA